LTVFANRFSGAGRRHACTGVIAWRSRTLMAALLAAAIAACTTVPPAPPAPPAPARPPAPVAPPEVKTRVEARYEAVGFDVLPALAEADLRAAWPALLKSCDGFGRRSQAAWEPLCRAARAAGVSGGADPRAILVAHLRAWRVRAATRPDTAEPGAQPIATADTGLCTGYYEPQLAGSRRRTPPFVVPLYRVPDDLLTVDLGSVYPELAGKRVRGRLDGRRVVPYWTRAEIEAHARPGTELFWVDDPVEAFFLQIQGSGRVRLADGTTVRVGFADANGQPYRSIGRVLVERGEMTAEEASMQRIQAWGRAHPDRVDELLNANPSFVFFRELPLGDPRDGPVGAFGVALTPGYSVAVDPRFVPLGSPIVVSTMDPATQQPLRRMMFAQDTGGAIRGPLRFDFFWGSGAEAGAIAGRQRGEIQAWLLLPRGVAPDPQQR
jgi:membrane-bound lytic murein transglycosylase A